MELQPGNKSWAILMTHKARYSSAIFCWTLGCVTRIFISYGFMRTYNCLFMYIFIICLTESVRVTPVTRLESLEESGSLSRGYCWLEKLTTAADRAVLARCYCAVTWPPLPQSWKWKEEDECALLGAYCWSCRLDPPTSIHIRPETIKVFFIATNHCVHIYLLIFLRQYE